MDDSVKCDCRYAQFQDHSPHKVLFCSAPVHLSPEDAEIMRRPPQPLKIIVPMQKNEDGSWGPLS